MNKENKHIELVPKFRFKEFVEDGEWEEMELGDLGEIFTGKTPSTKNQSLWNGKILFITPTDISENKYQVTTKRTIKKTEKLKVLPPNSIVYTCIASIGKMAMTTHKSVTNQQINSIVPSEIHENEFIYYLLVSLTPYIKSIPATSTLPIINKTQFYGIKCKIPKQKEQQKIAATLSSLDALLQAETERLALLKEHKKGLLQQLFPKQGEKVPQLRFEEFVGDGDWEEKMLGDCLNGKSSQIAKNKLTLVEKGYPIYGADGLIGYIEIFTQKKDYIAVVKDGSGVGNLFLYKEKSSLLGTLTYLLSKDEKKYNLSCLYYLLQTIDFKPFVKGSGIPHIYFKDYSKLKIYLPNPKEQQKIANTLSSVDELIETQAEKIAALKEHKKGLMQGLFPNTTKL